jgi:hypothetical protein
MRFALVVLSGLMALPFAAPALASSFSGSEIRSDIIGRTIFLAAPFGGEFPLNYRPGGQVDGDGEASGFAGRLAQPKDTGRWWIDGNRLCQQFQNWYNGAPMCFELTRTGPNTLNWVRDNGETGRARIGGAL